MTVSAGERCVCATACRDENYKLLKLKKNGMIKISLLERENTMERAKVKEKVWLRGIFSFVLLFSLFLGTAMAARAAGILDKDKDKLTAYTKTEDGYSEASGITVKTTTNEKSYRSGDKAVITLEVTNTNNFDVSEVELSYKLPANFEKEAGQKPQSIETLKAGETQKLSINATVSEDWSAPMTVGFLVFLIVGGSLLAAAIVAVILIVVKKRKGKKAAAMFLIFVMAANVASGTSSVVQAEETPTAETGNYEVDDEKFMSHVSVHDPSVVKDPKTGMYYIFGSHLAFAKSKDLMEWEKFTNNINTDYATLFKEPWDEWAKTATKESQLSGMMWAPDVIWNEKMQKWCMYMSINGDNWVSSICLLTADDIEGPYEYKGIVVYSGMNNAKMKVDETKTDVYKVLGEGADLSRYHSTDDSCINAIDPNVQYDDKGDLYMTYGSWSAGIYQLKLDSATGLRDYNATYETKKDVSDAYYGVKIAGGYYCSGEGPYLLKTDDYYYLFLSYAGLEAQGGYQMRIYRSKDITGPYVDDNGVSAIRTKGEDVKLTNYGYRIFGSYDIYGLTSVQVAQGHNSAFIDDDGKMYLVYHTRFQSPSGTQENHSVRVHQLFINEDGWPVAAPYEYTGETISEDGYAMEDMAGAYEFVYHEPTSFYRVAGQKQLGIVGRTRKLKEIEGTKDITIGHHISTIEVGIKYVQEAGDSIILHEDGTVTGEYKGTWTYKKNKMTIQLGDKVYKGVFLKQANEDLENHDMTMTFTAEGGNVAVWGIKNLVPEKKEEE